MTVLDGKTLSKKIKEELKVNVKANIEKYHETPCMAIVLVGQNPASMVYVKNKIKSAAYVGMETTFIQVEENITEEELLSIVYELNGDEKVHGIIVQLPLPKHINEQHIIDAIIEEKDIDGFGVINKGKLFSGLDSMVAATPKGIMRLLKEYHVELKGKEAVVVGRSNIVGKPVALLLLNENATVTIAHSRTVDLPSVTRRADILVVAIGKANFITSDMVKDGAVIVDVGINRVNDKLCGDVDFEGVMNKCSYISPVPGGVGPLTIASLLENTLLAYQKIMEKKYKI